MCQPRHKGGEKEKWKEQDKKESMCENEREIHTWLGGEIKDLGKTAFVYTNFNYTSPLMTPLECLRLEREAVEP